MVIYLTTNLTNGRKYIGKDRNNLKSYLGGGTGIRKAIKKYGRVNFKKEILETCSSIEELSIKEIEYLIKYDACNNPLFYNKTNKSYGAIYGRKGLPHTKETKKKISEAQKNNKNALGHTKNKESKIKIGEANSKPKPKDFGKKISDIKKGKPSFFKGKNRPENNKAVLCLDSKGNIIKEYSSQISAQQALGLSSGAISGGIKTGYKRGGYYWKYSYINNK
tara:strand:+ start:54 stop:716 length:663 start_codon:yes stop_codon:yes gene_type:complete